MNTALAFLMAAVFGLTSFSPAVMTYAAGETETAAVEEPAKEQEDRPYEQSVTVKKNLKVTARADAGVLPNEAELKVEPITKGDDYKDIEKKIRKDVQDDDRELSGFLAYDISFEVDGQETEPNGKVDVTMEWDKAALPDDVEKGAEVSVLHLTDDDEIVDLTQNDVKEKDKDKDNIATVKTTGDEKSVRKMEMTVDGFSVFTITWSVSADNKSTIGNVSMHYIDVKGLEIDRTATVQAADLAKNSGDIVKISDWVENSDNTRKVSGYIFQKATLGRNGTEITGLKVSETSSGSNTYKLYYTTDENPTADSTWTEYKDSSSGNDSNNADIYLYFKSTAQRVNVHYVDEDGNILINPQYKYADKVTTDNAGVDISTWTETIQDYEFTGCAHMGETGWNGFAFKKIKSVTEGSDGKDTHATYRFQYKLKDNDKDWTDLTATDVYLIYRKTSGTKLITIHYIDRNGNAITDEAGNKLTKVVDAGEWEDSTWYNLPGLGEDIDGYEKDADSGTTGGADGHGILTKTDGTNFSDTSVFTRIKGNRTIYDSLKFGSVQGKTFRYICYVAEGDNAGIQVGEGGSVSTSTRTVSGGYNTSTVNGAWTLSGDFDIYLVYKPATSSSTYKYTVHYVDEDGNEIPDSGTAQKNITADTVTLSGLKKTISGYEAEDTGYLGRATSETGGIPFTSITFAKQTDGSGNETGKWTYSVKNGEDTEASDAKQLNLHNLNIYVVYKAVKVTDNARVVVHHVDEQGNTLHADTYPDGNGNWTISSTATQTRNGSTVLVYGNYWNGNSRTPSDNAFTKESNGTVFTIDGYTMKDIYIGYIRDGNKYTNDDGSYKGGAIVWNYKTDANGANGQWHTGYGLTGGKDASEVSGEETATVTEVYNAENKPELMTDIYVVYRKTNTLNIHYVKVGTDNTLTKIDSESDTTATPGTKASPTDLTSSTYAKKITNLVHIGTRIGPSWPTSDTEKLSGADLGPNVTQVYADNGQLYYSFSNLDSPYPLTRQGTNNIWIYAASSGRRFTLTKDGDNYTIGDSQHGTFTLNKSADNTWIATFHGEAETTEYTVKKSTTSQTTPGTGTTTTVDTYTLTLRDYMPNNLTDVYEMYIDDSNEAKVWIDDDLKYSGYFMVGRNDWLETRMASTYSGNDKITSYYYTWDKITNGTNTTTVERQQNGIHYNLAYNRVDRTWLDIEADNGGRNTTDQKTVSYKVTMHYKQGDGDWKEVSSEPVAVQYYSQLMNGDFEDANIRSNSENYEATSKWTHYYSNEQFKNGAGVWQTTSPGTGDNADADIELANTNSDYLTGGKLTSGQGENVTASSYCWYGTYAAASGEQFAELNAESAGALYQDVVTHPNQHLNYWLSHRARGNKTDSTPEYDTMYVVIMPTKLAMTGSSTGGELKTQTELEEFIREHGGYDDALATAVEQEVTYRDEDNGILILKVSSNDQFWHNVNVPNGYIAKSGLTRFFFVAGPITDTRAPAKTHGNFLDKVGFSQELQPPKGFSLVVNKTFRGLSTSEILQLAKDGYKIKITDKHADSSTYKNSNDGSEDNDALNGAVLSFEENAGGAGGKRFKLTAKDKNNNDLLTGSNSGDAIVNDDGSVTMTWTFADQSLRSNAGQAHEEYFNYYAEESSTDVTGYTLTATKTVTNRNQGESGTTQAATEEGAALITQHYSGTFNLENSYRKDSDSDQPRIVVTKKFIGLTPSGVQELFSDGYKLTVTNSKGTSEVLDTNEEEMSSNVSVSEPDIDANHNTTYTWHITGNDWGAGTYSIKEENYNTDEYKVTQIKISGSVIEEGEEGHKTPPSNNASKSDITVGGESPATLTYDSTADGSSSENTPLTSVTVNEGINLIISQYSRGGSINYVVWTPEPVGASVAQAIVNKINNATTDSGLGWGTTDTNKAKIGTNINFRSSKNGGTFSSSIGSFSYDPDAKTVTFTASGENNSWTKYFSAKVTGLDSADIPVENRYNPVVRVLKVDDSDSTKVLSDAVFNLYKVESNSKKYYMESTGTPTAYSWDAADASGKKKSSYTTDSNGYVLLPDLEPGTYYLEEVTAPSGYNKATKPITFTVNTDYSVVQTTLTDNKTSDGIEATNPVPDWKQPYYSITVTDKAGIQLPRTGGTGTKVFTVIGLLLIFTAGILLGFRGYRKKKHK